VQPAVGVMSSTFVVFRLPVHFDENVEEIVRVTLPFELFLVVVVLGIRGEVGILLHGSVMLAPPTVNLLDSGPMGRGSRARMRWRNDRQRKKKAREKRKTAPAEGRRARV
jgi:hypothetical protein